MGAGHPEAAIDSKVIDRRTALRAALGGAAAAAVFSAPRIEGFSIAPDYAAAGTCRVDPARTATVTGSKVLKSCCGQDLTTLCYGGAGCAMSCTGLTNCLTPNFTVPSTSAALNIPLNNNVPVANITLNYNVGGATREYITDWNNDSNVSAAISGLPAGKSCVVNVNGSCGSGTYRMKAANSTNNNENSGEWGTNISSFSETVNANSWSSLSRRKVDCYQFESDMSNASVAITIGISCTC